MQGITYCPAIPPKLFSILKERLDIYAPISISSDTEKLVNFPLLSNPRRACPCIARACSSLINASHTRRPNKLLFKFTACPNNRCILAVKGSFHSKGAANVWSDYLNVRCFKENVRIISARNANGF